MFSRRIHNVNIGSEKVLPTPLEIREGCVMSPEEEEFVFASRQTINDILDRKDKRLLVVVGPCSIHDMTAGIDYASRLRKLAEQVKDHLFIAMRVYFEKPRTSVGWKGFINDPDLDDTFNIEEGLRRARAFLKEVTRLQIPAATEALDPITPQYLNDFIAWTAIGARTTESQTHRELASGLSMAIGFKNGTDGNIMVAINALKACAQPHRFLGINRYGQVTVLETRGNRYGHIVLRGGLKTNYDAESVGATERALQSEKLPLNIMVDCSHGNSLKNPERQPLVLDDCMKQIEAGNKSIIGFMIESNIHAGTQTLLGGKTSLKYGVSITDGCISWETTETVLLDMCERYAKVSR